MESGAKLCKCPYTSYCYMRADTTLPQQGNSFFDGWDFQNSPDDTTHGVAMYIDRDTAVSLNRLQRGCVYIDMDI